MSCNSTFTSEKPFNDHKLNSKTGMYYIKNNIRIASLWIEMESWNVCQSPVQSNLPLIFTHRSSHVRWKVLGVDVRLDVTLGDELELTDGIRAEPRLHYLPGSWHTKDKLGQMNCWTRHHYKEPITTHHSWSKASRTWSFWLWLKQKKKTHKNV